MQSEKMFTITLETNVNCAQKVQYPFCEIKLPYSNYTLLSMPTQSKQSMFRPLQAYSGPEVSRKLRFPDFNTIGT
jgi:hypothetical protein